ncbi:MAG: helix-turn-helix domain-containing protein [Dysgonamonadaceae bacterium]|jgi:DNA-binding XRE family transcriptional regulator|nr:helix-turn-helix domain-containing protein [Dysgonamonadaceae bacterium]
MIRLDPEKVAKLHSFDDLLDKEYGKTGTLSRKAFHDKSLAYYYGEILKGRRKELKITQQQLADKVGKERSYIAYIEQGKTDMQLSTFLNITNALGLKFSLSV